MGIPGQAHTFLPFRGIFQGVHARLEPLRLDHLDALCAVGLDPELWKVTASLVRSREEMREYIATALKAAEAGTVLPFRLTDAWHHTGQASRDGGAGRGYSTQGAPR